MSIVTVYANNESARELRPLVQLLARTKRRPLVEMADFGLNGRVVNIHKLGVPIYNGVSVLAFGCGLINDSIGSKADNVRLISFLDEEQDIRDLDSVVHREKGKRISDLFLNWASADASVMRAMKASLSF